MLNARLSTPRQAGTALRRTYDLRLTDPSPLGRVSGTESAGLNRHIVGDARAPQERRSDSLLALSLALLSARAAMEVTDGNGGDRKWR